MLPQNCGSIFMKSDLRLCRNEFQLECHSHACGKALERPQRGIGCSAFQPADVSLRNAGDVGKLFLRHTVFLTALHNGAHDLTFRFLRIPLRAERRVLYSFVQSLTEILPYKSCLLFLIKVCAIPPGTFYLARRGFHRLFYKAIGEDYSASYHEKVKHPVPCFARTSKIPSSSTFEYGSRKAGSLLSSNSNAANIFACILLSCERMNSSAGLLPSSFS